MESVLKYCSRSHLAMGSALIAAVLFAGIWLESRSPEAGVIMALPERAAPAEGPLAQASVKVREQAALMSRASDAVLTAMQASSASADDAGVLGSGVQRALASRDGIVAYSLAAKLKACVGIERSLEKVYALVANTGPNRLPRDIYQRDLARLQAEHVQCQSVAGDLEMRRLELLRVAVDQKVIGASAELRLLAERLGTADLTPSLTAQVIADAQAGNMHSAFSMIAVASLGASEAERAVMLRAFQLASIHPTTETAARAYLEGLAIYRLPVLPETTDERGQLESHAMQVAKAMQQHAGQ